ncbi:MAG: hypothetical protein ACIPMY_03890 [Rickettsia endosymbiont of Pentastiridius leporinus]
MTRLNGEIRSEAVTSGVVGQNMNLNNITFSSGNIEPDTNSKIKIIGNRGDNNDVSSKNIIVSHSNINENFEVAIPNNEISIKVKGTAVEDNNFSTLLLTQITESAIVNNNITISSPDIGNTLIATRIDNLPLYYPGINEVTLGLLRPINFILPPNSICNFTNDTPLNVVIIGKIKVNNQECNNSESMKLNPHQKILIRTDFDIVKCAESTSSLNFYDNQNDNGGEGFGILIGDSNLVEVY